MGEKREGPIIDLKVVPLEEEMTEEELKEYLEECEMYEKYAEIKIKEHKEKRNKKQSDK